MDLASGAFTAGLPSAMGLAAADFAAGTYRGSVITFDKNPLDPSKKDKKWYVPGVGYVQAILHGGGHTETTKLVK